MTRTGLALWALAFAGSSLFAADNQGAGYNLGRPRYATVGSVSNFSANANTIPYFRSQFTDPTNGVTYPITMVGTDPAKGDRSTTVPVVIIPFKLSFVASASPDNVLDGSTKTALTVNSPVFRNSDVGTAANATASAPPFGARTVAEPSDVTQVGDAIYRAQWNKSGTGYHVLLGTPSVAPTQEISVPQNLGFLLNLRGGMRAGLMDIGWFSNRLDQTINSLHIDAGVLPIILVYNTFLYDGNNPANCCILGYHGVKSSLNGNGRQQVQTYIFASFSDPGIFSPNAGDAESFITDIHGLSHEVQEWLDDPFVTNIVNPWLTPTAPQYGCTAYLETGDPVVGYGFKITMPNGVTYHPEDEVHFSWFARQSPSQAAMGYYSYLNNFPLRAQGCN